MSFDEKSVEDLYSQRLNEMNSFYSEHKLTQPIFESEQSVNKNQDEIPIKGQCQDFDQMIDEQLLNEQYKNKYQNEPQDHVQYTYLKKNTRKFLSHSVLPQKQNLKLHQSAEIKISNSQQIKIKYQQQQQQQSNSNIQYLQNELIIQKQLVIDLTKKTQVYKQKQISLCNQRDLLQKQLDRYRYNKIDLNQNNGNNDNNLKQQSLSENKKNKNEWDNSYKINMNEYKKKINQLKQKNTNLQNQHKLEIDRLNKNMNKILFQRDQYQQEIQKMSKIIQKQTQTKSNHSDRLIKSFHLADNLRSISPIDINTKPIELKNLWRKNNKYIHICEIDVDNKQWQFNYNRNDRFQQYLKDKDKIEESLIIKSFKDGEGKTHNIYQNKKYEIIFQSGIKKEQFNDGYCVITFNNGDIKQIFKNGITMYYFKEAQATQTILPNGQKIICFNHELIEIHNPDGSKEIKHYK